MADIALNWSPRRLKTHNERRADVPNGNIVLPGGREGVCFRPCEVNVRVDAGDHRLSENPTIVEVFAQ